jgi:hypothetical protein
VVLRLRPADGAALVIRVWREPGVEGFRGRVRYFVGAARTGETVVVVDSPELVHATVQQWVEEFLTGGDPHPTC